MTGSMGLTMVLSTVAVFTLIAAAVYVGVRLARGAGRGESGQAVLDRRFPAGDISAEEYHEYGSALRSSASGADQERPGPSAS